MNPVQKVSRRGFLGTVFGAGALVLGSQIVPKSAQASTTNAAWTPNIFLGLDIDGTVTIIAHRSEMGTGIRTSLPMVVADELGAEWGRVKVQQALGDEAFGSQDTDGSCSIRDFYDQMREVGASARLMLERAAAGKWGVPASECKAVNHSVSHESSGREIGFGDLVVLAAQQPVPKKEELQLKSPAEFRYIGKGVPIVDLEALTTGKGMFAMDTRMPGMVFASIEHPPVLGGKVNSVDDSAARQVTGVSDVVSIPAFKPPHGFQPLGGVAVIADNTWSAMQGRRKLKIDWDLGANAAYDSVSFRKAMVETSHAPQKVLRDVGNVDAEFAKGGKVIEADYYTPLLAHAPMEPPAAIAEFKDGKCVVYAATQSPVDLQTSVAAGLGIDKKDVTCHVTLLGGGFGRKSKPDFAVEAAMLSKTVGKPVKVVWSREDDIRFDYYHSTAAMYMKAQLDQSGKPTAWLQRSVFPPIGSTFAPNTTYGDEGEMAMGWTDVPFEMPNHRAENGPAEAHVRIGWLRSVANVYHAFAVQSFVNELATAAGRDHIEYFLELLGPPRAFDPHPGGKPFGNYGKPLANYPWDTGRLRRVVEIARDKSGWGNGKNLGFAAHRSFLTYVAVVAEVDVNSRGQVRIPRVHMAIDCGQVIHPDRVKAQFEGAAVFGTSVAMSGEITASDGRVKQSNFDSYPVARINESPLETHVHIVASNEPPTGVGEPGVPPMAPAICNAIFAATGKRIRELPVRKTKLV
jgi:isoquinoline 1-oxidoreductase beta subunit